jgi:hypothetical protein
MFAEFDESNFVTQAFKKHWGWGVLALLIAVAWLLREEIAKHIWHHIRRQIRKKSFAEELVSELFEGKVELVTQEHIKNKATKKQVLRYYNGAKLDWKIIAANGDIPRDQYSELLESRINSSF